ncbi:MAG: Gfo/Idh/MocA family protein [bacterium]
MPPTSTTTPSPTTDTPLTAPLRVAVVGAGNRSTRYATYALRHPDRMRIVAVADPNTERARTLAAAHGLGAEACFASYQQLAEHPDIADAVINGTMDQLHTESTIRLLEAGFEVLLEKPIAPTEPEVRRIHETAEKHRRLVMVCHVLRYAPFYQQVALLKTSVQRA